MDITEQFELFLSQLAALNAIQAIAFVFLFLAVWFLPTLLALLLNRRNAKVIFIANIPAALSWIVWFGLLGWAVTGKLTKKAASHIKVENTDARQ